MNHFISSGQRSRRNVSHIIVFILSAFGISFLLWFNEVWPQPSELYTNVIRRASYSYSKNINQNENENKEFENHRESNSPSDFLPEIASKILPSPKGEDADAEDDQRQRQPETFTGCIYPKTPIYPHYLRPKWNQTVNLGCSYHKKIAEVVDDSVLVFNKDFIKSDCCIRTIKRRKLSDDLPNVSECKPISNGSKIEDKELFFVSCDEHKQVQFEARVPLKPHVKQKIDYWSKHPREERPYSVFIFGIDSTSRAHAYRSLPKTIDFMKNKLGFYDFDSYQSLASETLGNFMGLLMGLEFSQVREEGCAKNWGSSFDACPFIWKNFSVEGYVTSYVEDNDGAFNWGGRGGYKRQPTDYYLRSLFKTLEVVRFGQLEKLKQRDPKISHLNSQFDSYFGGCISSEMSPQFLVRYTRQLLKKFSEFPHFHMTWFGYPFHDHQLFHKTMDDALYDLLHDLSTNTKMMERTLIIFLSDHGDRFEGINEKSAISYLELVSPPLFIKIPDQLVKKFPHFANTFKRNSKILTTAFDLHHTLLHFLSLMNISKLENVPNFNPIPNYSEARISGAGPDPPVLLNSDGSETILQPGPGPGLPRRKSGKYSSRKSKRQRDYPLFYENRSSLFIPLNKSRTCSQLKVSPHLCACNTTFDEYSETGKDFNSADDQMIRNLLRDFVMNHLNSKINGSKYANVCSVIQVNQNTLNFQLLSTTDSFVEHVVKFRDGLHDDVTFYARVKTYKKGRESELKSESEERPRMEFMGYARTSKYRDKVWCINQETDQDKIMKGLCICKNVGNTFYL